MPFSKLKNKTFPDQGASVKPPSAAPLNQEQNERLKNAPLKATSDTRLVYSTDPALNQKCTRCKELKAACICEVESAVQSKFVANLRMEKSGRGGKTVTVISELPKNELFLKELTTYLKKKCGTGGTYLMEGKEGTIEIQGDRRQSIRELLAERKIRTKG